MSTSGLYICIHGFVFLNTHTCPKSKMIQNSIVSIRPSYNHVDLGMLCPYSDSRRCGWGGVGCWDRVGGSIIVHAKDE